MNSPCLTAQRSSVPPNERSRPLRVLYPRIPPRLRHVAPYHEACARLAGHSRPGPLTRLLNRLWIGRDSMAG